MKKRMSVAGLALQLTWIPVLVLFAAVFVGQQLLFWLPLRQGMDIPFEHHVEEHLAFLGWLGVILTALTAVVSSSSYRRCDFGMTLSRLGISSLEVTVQFGLVFAGYFLLYWAVQFATITMLYARSLTPEQMEDGWTPVWYFLAAYRCPYLHLLMPLRDILGYVRNVLGCVAFGMMTAAARTSGTERANPLLAILVLAWLGLFVFLQDPLAGQSTDLCLSLAFAVLTALVLWGSERRKHHEKA